MSTVGRGEKLEFAAKSGIKASSLIHKSYVSSEKIPSEDKAVLSHERANEIMIQRTIACLAALKNRQKKNYEKETEWKSCDRHVGLTRAFFRLTVWVTDFSYDCWPYGYDEENLKQVVSSYSMSWLEVKEDKLSDFINRLEKAMGSFDKKNRLE